MTKGGPGLILVYASLKDDAEWQRLILVYASLTDDKGWARAYLGVSKPQG